MNTQYEIVCLEKLNQDNLILIVDVDYRSTFAKVSGVVIDNWASNKCAFIETTVDSVTEYESGAFYKRELPCILALINTTKVKFKTIVIDGYVTLGEDQRMGLGSYLFKALDSKVPVIGVAKTYFKGTPNYQEVYRNNSTKALYVTSSGISPEDAKSSIINMHGKYRLPTMLKLVDTLCRN